MPQVRSRVRRSRQQWRVLVDEWEASGLPARVFASSRGLNQNTLQWWRRELNKEADVVSLVELVPRAKEPRLRPPEALRRPLAVQSMIEVSVGEHAVRLPATCGPVRAAALVAALLWAR